MIKPEDLNLEQRSAYDVWRWMGLSEQAAMNALRQDGLVEVSEFDRTVSAFRDVFGLSEQAAEIAAAGRHTSVSEARRSWGSAGSSSGDRREPWQLAQEALDRMTDAECDQLLEEQRKRRKPAKKAAPAKQPSSSKITTVSETTYPRGRR